MSATLRGVRIVRGTFVLEIDAALTSRCTAILGASGSGKTTVLEALAGLLRPASGRIEIDGDIVSDGASHAFVPAHRRRVGYVPQDGALFPHLSVRANLLYGSHGTAMGMDGVVDLLDIRSLLDRRVPSLSGGEKRRVAVGRALLSGPRLLLLDEPLTGLDRSRKRRALELLRRVRDEIRVPMVLVTHDEAEAADLAEAAIHVDEGRVVAPESDAAVDGGR